jgi:hypothetical protein
MSFLSILKDIKQFFISRQYRKERKRKYKYILYTKKRIHMYDSMYSISKIANGVLDKIMEVGIKTMEVGPHFAHGVLNNGDPFAFWVANLWYGWASNGQVGDMSWDGNKGNQHKTIESTTNHLCGIIPKSKIPFCPTEKCKTRFRKYLLSIDEDMFYYHFLNRDGKKYDGHCQKLYDLTEFNREKRINILLNE